MQILPQLFRTEVLKDGTPAILEADDPELSNGSLFSLELSPNPESVLQATAPSATDAPLFGLKDTSQNLESTKLLDLAETLSEVDGVDTLATVKHSKIEIIEGPQASQALQTTAFSNKTVNVVEASIPIFRPRKNSDLVPNISTARPERNLQQDPTLAQMQARGKESRLQVAGVGEVPFQRMRSLDGSLSDAKSTTNGAAQIKSPEVTATTTPPAKQGSVKVGPHTRTAATALPRPFDQDRVDSGAMSAERTKQGVTTRISSEGTTTRISTDTSAKGFLPHTNKPEGVANVQAAPDKTVTRTNLANLGMRDQSADELRTNPAEPRLNSDPGLKSLESGLKKPQDVTLPDRQTVPTVVEIRYRANAIDDRNTRRPNDLALEQVPPNSTKNTVRPDMFVSAPIQKPVLTQREVRTYSTQGQEAEAKTSKQFNPAITTTQNVSSMIAPSLPIPANGFSSAFGSDAPAFSDTIQSREGGFHSLGESTNNSKDASNTAKIETFARPVAQQLVQAAKTLADGTVEVKLAPEELGRVRLSLNPNDTHITVHISAERPETADLIRRNIELLSAALKQEGFSNLEFSFGEQGRNDMSSQTEKDSLLGSDDNAETETTPSEQSNPKNVANGQLDIRI